MRQKAIIKAYDLLQSLAYTSRLATEVRDQSGKLAKMASGSLSKKLVSISVQMDSIHSKIVSTREGKITGEEKLREKIAFIYGSMMGYPGPPTSSQLQGLDLLSRDAWQVETAMNGFITGQLPKINQELIRAKQAEIRIISRENFNAEP
jgi:hypothetical protein